MKSPENFGEVPKTVEEKELQDASRIRPMGKKDFEKVAEELAKKAKEEGFEAIGQLPPEPFPVKGGEQEDIAA